MRHADVLAIVFVGLLLRLVALGSEPLWFDEFATVKYARQPILSLLGADTHPPLYYMLMHAVVGLGESHWLLRFPSVVLSTMTIAIVYLLGRTIGDRRLGLIAALLVAVAPVHVEYAQEARNYALLAFAASTAMLGLANVLRPPGAAALSPSAGGGGTAVPPSPRGTVAFEISPWLAWLAYGGGTVIVLYTHNTGFFLLAAAQVAYFLAYFADDGRPRSDLRKWITVNAFVVLLWLPYLPWAVSQAQNVVADFWIPPASAERIAYVLWEVLFLRHGPYPDVIKAMLAAAMSLAALLGLWSFRRQLTWQAFCGAFVAVPFLIALALDPIRPVLLDKVMIWTTIPFYLLVAAGCLALPTLLTRLASLSIVVGAMLVGVVDYHLEYEKEAWDQAAAVVRSNAGPVDVFLFYPGTAVGPFGYYFEPRSEEAEASTGVQSPQRFREQVKTALAHGADGVWLVSRYHQREVAEMLASLGGHGTVEGMFAWPAERPAGDPPKIQVHRIRPRRP